MIQFPEPERAVPRLAQLCRAQHLDRERLAEALGVDEQTVHGWESGETRIPEACLPRLSEIFGVSVAFIVGEDLWS